MKTSREIMESGLWTYARSGSQHVFFNPEEKIVYVSSYLGGSKKQLPTVVQDKIDTLPPGTFTNWTTRHFRTITAHWIAETVEILQNQGGRLVISKKTFRIV